MRTTASNGSGTPPSLRDPREQARCEGQEVSSEATREVLRLGGRDRSMMKGALENITQAVGNTPIVKLNRVGHGVAADIYVKCEYLNPGGSHKDRVAINMIRRAEEAGLKPGGT